MPRLRKHERWAVSGDLWWELFDENQASRFSDGHRDYVEQFALAVHDSNPLLNFSHLRFLCRALWEACIR